MRNYERSISDVQGGRAVSYANQNQRNANNQRAYRISNKPTNNFQLLSRPSQTTVLTNISRLELNLNDRSTTDIDNAVNEKIKKRNDKYFNRLCNIFKMANGSNGFSDAPCSNSISNSSLQDLDETEFSSSDLVKYMEEINDEIA